MAKINFVYYVCNESILPLLASGEGDSIVISSYGGDLDAGYAAAASIISKKQNTVALGCVASAATVMFLAGLKRQCTSTTTFILHNPMTQTDGNAKEIEEALTALKFEQEKLLNFYSERLTIPKEEIASLLDKDIKIDAKEALRIGLVTDIVEIFNLKNMPTFNEKLISIAKKWNIPTNKTVKPKNAVNITSVDGIQYQFPDIDTPDQIANGIAVKDADGKPYSGQITMQDGTVIECQNGVVIGIESSQMSEDEMMAAIDSKIEAVEAENTSLKAQIQNLKDENSRITTEYNTHKTTSSAEITELKAKVTALFDGDDKNGLPVASKKTKNVRVWDETLGKNVLKQVEI